MVRIRRVLHRYITKPCSTVAAPTDSALEPVSETSTPDAAPQDGVEPATASGDPDSAPYECAGDRLYRTPLGLTRRKDDKKRLGDATLGIKRGDTRLTGLLWNMKITSAPSS